MLYLTLWRTCAKGIWRELSKCVTTSTSVSFLTAQLVTASHRAALMRIRSGINSALSVSYPTCSPCLVPTQEALFVLF